MTPEPQPNAVVLIVDDNPTNLSVLSAHLEAAGFALRVAQDGESALRVAALQLPDLIVLDILMPGIDGFETCRRLKNNPLTREIPVIFMSALSDPVDKVKGLSLGAVDYITKPFQRDEVLARLQLHLKMRRLTQALADRSRRLQEEIRNRRHAEGASQAKSQFLAKMSHELRTPLNAILGFSQLMERDKTLTEEQREYLRIICRSGEHLLTLINDVLELSKIEAGKVTLKEAPVRLDRLLQGVTDMLAWRAQAKGLSFEVYCSDDVPPCIRTDEGKLRQVAINLLSNAIKFTEFGSVALRVGAVPQSGDRVRLYFEVEDTGPGIAPEELETIFEAFVQTQTGYRSEEGTGLGLPISRQLVQLMGGDITLDSVLGVGTIAQFDIIVPVETQPIEIGDSSETPKRRVVRPLADRPVPKLLVVDDRRESRQFLVKLLEVTGFEVRSAEDGQAAIAQWKAWQPDLIWMDVRMPVMDGYEATRQIKAQQKKTGAKSPTAIVALTASAFEEERASVLAVGCDDFLRKPFREEEIFEKIARHLGVRYLYEMVEDTASESVLPSLELTSEDLASMPVQWRMRLRYGAMSANDAIVRSLIDEIPEESAALAERLTVWLEDFRFDKIFALVPQEETLSEDEEKTGT
ncbi:response regulator [Baaleninema simplex]|uniref:response regulator n=1 Tax=Baaleninema simplex TaxID=2862350 RepID=UPI00034CDE56|nr:response regulator [Baaleninema simplex]